MISSAEGHLRMVSLNPIGLMPKLMVKIGEGATDGKTQFCPRESPVVVIVVPISPTGRTVLLTQSRSSAKKEFWEIPAGHRKDSEFSNQSAFRELKEKTGLSADNVILIAQFYGIPRASKFLNKVYVAPVTDKQLDEIKLPRDEDKITSVHVIKMSKVFELIARGNLNSVTTMVTFSFIDSWQAKLSTFPPSTP